MSDSIERYQKLGFKEALSRIHHYPIACKDLSVILREAYDKLPKNLRPVVFQDTVAAFRLLPLMQTRGAVSAAHLLLQSAEAALPKQKKSLAVKEFKNAMVAHKRRCKTQNQDERTTELPPDVLLHIFSFLDMKSLASVGQVCWSWNSAASSNQLWESRYSVFFGDKHHSAKTRERQNCRQREDKEFSHLQIVDRSNIDWREAFKRSYIGKAARRLASNRGYCGLCKTIVWLDNMRCCNTDHGIKSGNQQIVPVSPHQVVEYLLNGSSSMLYSSDSDSEPDEGLFPRLWAYPKNIGRCQSM